MSVFSPGPVNNHSVRRLNRKDPCSLNSFLEALQQKIQFRGVFRAQILFMYNLPMHFQNIYSNNLVTTSITIPTLFQAGCFLLRKSFLVSFKPLIYFVQRHLYVQKIMKKMMMIILCRCCSSFKPRAAVTAV